MATLNVDRSPVVGIGTITDSDLVGSYDISTLYSRATGVAKKHNDIFISGGDSSFIRKYDASNGIASLSLKQSRSVASDVPNVIGIGLYNDKLYLLGPNRIIKVFNSTDLDNGSFETQEIDLSSIIGSDPRDMHVESESEIYIVNNAQGTLYKIDATDRQNPLSESYNLSQNIAPAGYTGVSKYRDSIYVIYEGGDCEIIELDSSKGLSKLSQVSRYKTTPNSGFSSTYVFPSGLLVDSGQTYLVEGNTDRIFQFQQPQSNAVASNNPIYWEFSNALGYKVDFSNQSKVGEFDPVLTNERFNSLFVDDNELYILDGGNDLIYYYNKPDNVTNMTLVSSLPISTLFTTEVSIYKLGSLFYVMEQSGLLHEFDISSGLTSMTLNFQQQLTDGDLVTSPFQNVNCFAMNGDSLYLCGSNSSNQSVIEKYDISNGIQNIEYVTSYNLNSSVPNIRAIDVYSNFFYAIGQDNNTITELKIDSNVATGNTIAVPELTASRAVRVDQENIYTTGKDNNILVQHSVRASSQSPLDYVEFQVKLYTNTEGTIQTIQTRKENPFSGGIIPIFDVSNTVKDYIDFSEKAINDQAYDSYFVRIEYEGYLDNILKVQGNIPDIQVIRAAKQQGNEYGQNMGAYVIQEKRIEELYKLPIVSKTPTIYKGYPYYISSYSKGLIDLDYRINKLDVNKKIIEKTKVQNASFVGFFDNARSNTTGNTAIAKQGDKLFVKGSLENLIKWDISQGISNATEDITINSTISNIQGMDYYNGNLYILDANKVIHVFDLSTNTVQSQTIDMSSITGFGIDLHVESEEEIYLLINTSRILYKIDATNRASPTFQSFNLGTQIENLEYRGISKYGNFIYVVHAFNDCELIQLDCSNGFSNLTEVSRYNTDSNSGQSATYDSPRGLLVENGNVYIAEEFTEDIFQFSYDTGNNILQRTQSKNNEVLDIEPYISDDSKHLSVEIDRFGTAHTDKYTFKVENSCVDNPFYVIYENTLGGIDSLMLDINQVYTINTDEIGRFKNNELDLSLKTSYEDSNGFTNVREVQCFTEQPKENEEALINLILSRNIYHINENGDRIKVNVQPGSYDLVATEENNISFTVTFDMTPYNSI